MLFEKIHLEDTEKVLRVVRKHWFIIVSELFSIFLMALLPLIIIFSYNVIPESLQLIDSTDPRIVPLTVFSTCAWMLLTFLVGFTIWTNYYLDIWIITDRRIIFIDQRSFFHRNVSMFRLERLQDIEIKMVGIIPTFLNYGTLTAQTAGHSDNNFSSYGLPDPRGLQATIQRAMDARLKSLHMYDGAALH
jgi:hypothetical protein